MSNFGLNEILSDSDFIKSKFYYDIPSTVANSEREQAITRMYALYHTSLWRDATFNNPLILGRIFSFIDALDNFANCRLVERRFRNCIDKVIMKGKWQKLETATDLPLLNAEAERIEKRLPDVSGWSKLGILFRSLRAVPQDSSIDLSLGKLEHRLQQQLDHATQSMWREPIRAFIVGRPGIENVPEADASVGQIREFLKSCDRLNEIKTLDLSDLELSVAPPELMLFTGLQKLCLHNNQLTRFEIPDECEELQFLNLGNNQLTSFEMQGLCPKLERLVLRYNQLIRFEIPCWCEKLRGVWLDINQRLKDVDVVSNNGGANIMMFMPDRIYEQIDNFYLFKKQMTYVCQTPLAQLYQAIMKDKSREELKDIFLSLHFDDRKLILEMMQSKKNFYQYQSAPIFIDIYSFDLIQTLKDNPDAFYFAVQQSILEKYSKLSAGELNKVYEKLYELVDSSIIVGDKWGDLPLENIPRLADAISLCGL